MNKAERYFPKMHVGIKVKDLEASIRFYSLLFGLAPVKIKQNYAKFMLQEPPLVLSLSASGSIPEKQGVHYGIQLESQEQLRSWKKQVQQRGLPIHSEQIGTQCCYALQDKFWMKDPEGLMWEMYFFHQDVDENDKSYEDPEQFDVKKQAPLAGEMISAKSNCCGPKESTKKPS